MERRALCAVALHVTPLSELFGSRRRLLRQALRRPLGRTALVLCVGS